MIARAAVSLLGTAGFGLALAACTHLANEPKTEEATPGAAAPAPSSAATPAPKPEPPWFSTGRERQARLERELARELEVTLRTAPGVEQARVHLTLPAPPPLVSPSPAPEAAKAFVLIQHGSSPSPWVEGQVQRLVAAAVPGLDAQRITVVQHLVPPEPASPGDRIETAWVQVGPLRVEQKSARLLRVLLGAGSAAGVLLVLLVGASWLRLRVVARKLVERAP